MPPNSDASQQSAMLRLVAGPACVITAIVLGNVAGGLGDHSLGWLVPVVVLGCVFLRLRHR